MAEQCLRAMCREDQWLQQTVSRNSEGPDLLPGVLQDTLATPSVQPYQFLIHSR